MVIIIGTGLAGYMLAKEFRKLDKTTELMLITKDDGAFYSKPLLSTSLTNKKTPTSLAINTAEQMAQQLQATVLTHVSVSAINPQDKTVTAEGVTYSYSRLVLACGAGPLHVPLAGDAVDETFSINTLEDYSKFRAWLTPEKKRIAIIGSGLVGCELANDLINTGHEVEIATLDSYPLAKFVPPKIGQVLQQRLAEKGVIWHMAMPVMAINKHAGKYTLSLENESHIQADGVISAVGLYANFSLAKSVGLEVNRGIVVNRQLQTSDPNIFALGDCAEVDGEIKQYVAPILHCAGVLANVLTGGTSLVNYPVMPVVIKTPACPLVALPPPVGLEGSWQYDGEGVNLRALYYDPQHQLRGFALIGEKVRERMALTKQVAAPLV